MSDKCGSSQQGQRVWFLAPSHSKMAPEGKNKGKAPAKKDPPSEPEEKEQDELPPMKKP
jgi:hypothetical protein